MEELKIRKGRGGAEVRRGPTTRMVVVLMVAALLGLVGFLAAGSIAGTGSTGMTGASVSDHYHHHYDGLRLSTLPVGSRPVPQSRSPRWSMRGERALPAAHASCFGLGAAQISKPSCSCPSRIAPDHRLIEARRSEVA